MRNLQTCFPEKSLADITALSRQSLQHTACTALEMGKAWLWPLPKTCALVTEQEGLEAFSDALSQKKGVILLVPHLSNWEIFGFFICHHTEDSTFMYQPPKLPALDRLLKQKRSRGGINLAPANRHGVAELLKALHRGGLVGLLPDQVPTEGAGQFASFFGQPALTLTLVSKLLARRKVPVFLGFAERLPGGSGFKAVVLEAHPSIYSEGLTESVQGLNYSVEVCVLRAVPQYQWEYKRFRRQADGSRFY